MEISISTTFDFKMSPEVMMPMVSQAGFHTISLAGGNYEESKYLTTAGRGHMQNVCKTNDIIVDSIHAPLGSEIDIAHPEDRIRTFSVDLMKQAVYACCEMNCHVLMLHLCNRFPENELGERIVAVRESLRELVPYAAQKGIKLAIENLVADTTFVLFERMLSEFKDAHVGVCYDTSHAYLADNMYSLLESYGDRIIAVHISDNKGQLDDHMLPFEGKIDWTEFMYVFSKIAFSGTFLLEVEMRESAFKEPAVFLREAFQRGTKLFNSIKKG